MRESKRNFKYNLGENGKHIPNKDEAKLLRKLMSQTGMDEEEIRGIKKYRKQLSEAAKKGSVYNNKRYWWTDDSTYFWKQVTKKTGLVREHPISIYVYNKMLKNSYRYMHRLHPINLSNKQLEFLKNVDLTKYDNI